MKDVTSDVFFPLVKQFTLCDVTGYLERMHRLHNRITTRLAAAVAVIVWWCVSRSSWNPYFPSWRAHTHTHTQGCPASLLFWFAAFSTRIPQQSLALSLLSRLAARTTDSLADTRTSVRELGLRKHEESHGHFLTADENEKRSSHAKHLSTINGRTMPLNWNITQIKSPLTLRELTSLSFHLFLL